MVVHARSVGAVWRDLLRPEILREIDRFDLRVRFLAEGFLAGVHRSLRRGFSAEFASHRRYGPGDPVRTVDWAAWARTGRLYVKEFAADTSMNGFLVLDCSASMGYGWPLSKLQYAACLAGALAYLMNRQGDPAAVLSVSRGKVRGDPPEGKPGALARAWGRLATLEARGSGAFAATFQRALAAGRLSGLLRKRGLIALFSDLWPAGDLASVRRLISALRAKGHDMIVFHVLDSDETELPFRGELALEDMETGRSVVLSADEVRPRYRRRVAEWREELRRMSASLGADFVPLETSSPFGEALVRYLIRRAGK